MEYNNINYSIIIPHKNNPELLQRCLDSIPRRSDLEIIVVDDNSAPDLVDFYCFPGLNNSHIKIIFSKAGKGAGYARNIGLRESKGKWLIFADADDFFNECLNEVLDKYKELSSEIDLVLFKTNSVDSETLFSIKPRGYFYNQWIDKSLNENHIDERNIYKRNPPWGKFFSRKLIRNYDLLFDEVFAANDVMFSLKSAVSSQKIVVDNHVIYCATSCKGSIEKKTNRNYQLSRFEVGINHFVFLYSIDKLKYRSNIWKVFLRSILVFNIKDMMLYVKKSFQAIPIKYLIIDFITLPFLVVEKIYQYCENSFRKRR